MHISMRWFGVGIVLIPTGEQEALGYLIVFNGQSTTESKVNVQCLLYIIVIHDGDDDDDSDDDDG